LSVDGTITKNPAGNPCGAEEDRAEGMPIIPDRMLVGEANSVALKIAQQYVW